MKPKLSEKAAGVLYEYVRDGDVAGVRFLANQYRWAASQLHQAIRYAAHENSSEVLTALLDLPEGGSAAALETLLRASIESGNLRFARRALDLGAPLQSSAARTNLLIAIGNLHVQTARLLLQRGVSLDDSSVWQVYQRAKQDARWVETVEMLFEHPRVLAEALARVRDDILVSRHDAFNALRQRFLMEDVAKRGLRDAPDLSPP